MSTQCHRDTLSTAECQFPGFEKQLTDLGLSHEDAELVASVEKLRNYAERILLWEVPDKDRLMAITKKVEVYHQRKNIPRKTSPEVAPDPEPEKPKRKRVCEKPYVTFKQMRLLCAIAETHHADLATIALMAGMTQKGAKHSLQIMEGRNWVVEGLNHLGETIWWVTAGGLSTLFSFSRKFLHISNTGNSGNRHRKNFPSEENLKTIGTLLEVAETVIKELKGLGWYPRIIRPIMAKHKVAYMMYMIQQIKKRDDLPDKKKGAYLYKLLSGTVSKETRINSIARRTLADLPKDAVAMYKHVCLDEDLAPREFVHLAYALRKLHLAYALRKLHRRVSKKGGTVTVGDVRGVLGWIQKRRAGVKIV